MELRQLQHFVMVAEERSFTRAALRLNLVQSAVSVSVKGLETELGVTLFERTTRRLSLTDAGTAFLPAARATLLAADGALEAVHAASGGYRGTLRLGIMQSLRLVDLAGLLARFNEERPGVDILPRTAPRGSSDMINDLVSGELDVAFVSVVGTPPRTVHFTPLVTVPIRLAVPVAHRLAKRNRIDISELGGESFIETPKGWGLRDIGEKELGRAGVSREIRVEVGDMATVLELVRAGLGLAFVPEPSPVSPEGVRFIHLRPEPTFTVSLAVPADRRLSAAAAAFVEMVVGNVEAGQAPLVGTG